MSLRSALADGLEVRPHEQRLVGLLVLHSFLVGIPRILTSTVAMALFLARFDPSDLPYVYMAAAVAVPATGWLRLRLTSLLSVRRLFAFDLALVLVVLVSFRLLLGLPAGQWWVALLLPVWYEVEWVLLNLEFWGLAGHLLNVRQGKRLFGLIGAGELVAGTLAGLAVPSLVARLGTANLLLVSAGAVAASMGLLFLISPPPLPARTSGVEEDRTRRRGRFGELLRSRYLALLFALVALSYLGYYVVDNSFYSLAHRRYPDADRLASFLGLFWAVSSGVTILVRSALAGRVLTRYGVAGGLLALPTCVGAGVAAVAVGGLAAASVPALFWAMALTKLADLSLRESLDRSAVLVLYQPLPPGRRLRAQTAVEGIVGPLAGGLAGLVLIGLIKGLQFDPVHLSIVLVAVVSAWIGVAVALRTEYTRVLAQALAARRLSGASLALRDASSVDLVRRGLGSPHAPEVLYCLGVLEDMQDPALPEGVSGLLGHPSPEVRREALLRVERLGLGQMAAAVRVLAGDPDPAVRGAALRALAAVGDADDLDRLHEHLDDPEAEVRLGARVGLLRNGGIEGVLAAGGDLVTDAASGGPERRRFAARLIGEVGIASFYRPLLRLLEDPEPEVRQAAIDAAARLSNPRLWPLVIRALDHPALRSSAFAALVAGGEDVLGALDWSFDVAGERRDRPAQRRFVRICAQVRGETASEWLLRRVDVPDAEVRLAVLSALALRGHRAPPGEAAQVHERLLAEVAEGASLLGALADLQGSPVLGSALDHALDGARHRMFHLLAFVRDPEALFRARVSLGSRAAETRARAVDLVDSVLSQDEKDVFLPFLEDLSPEERLARLQGRFPVERLGREGRLRRLLDGGAGASPWLRACALHQAAEWGMAELAPEAEAALAAPEGVVREAAGRTLARLGRTNTGTETQEVAMLSTVEKVIVLKGVNIFSETPDEVLADVAAVLEEIEVGTGEAVFEKGDMGTALYVLVEGRVQILNEGRVLRELQARDIFGEMAALDPEPRSASVVALEPCRLFRLEQEALYELMADRVEVARGIIRVLCGRLRRVTA